MISFHNRDNYFKFCTHNHNPYLQFYPLHSPFSGLGLQETFDDLTFPILVVFRLLPLYSASNFRLEALGAHTSRTACTLHLIIA